MPSPVFAVVFVDIYCGEAFSYLYAITIEDGLYDLCSQEELRWIVAHEIKHLYQGEWNNDEEYKKRELDADRAAVESVGYEVAKSFMHKLSSLKIS